MRVSLRRPLFQTPYLVLKRAKVKIPARPVMIWLPRSGAAYSQRPMKRLIHVEVAQLADHTGQVPVIHSSCCGIGTLGTDQLGFFETHDKLTRDVPHEQVMDRFLGRLSHC